MRAGLVSAMFINESDASQREHACPDHATGLFVRTRAGTVAKVLMQPDQLVFQAGEVLQIMSGGLLQATPHTVRGSACPGLSRNTFAVFLQLHRYA